MSKISGIIWPNKEYGVELKYLIIEINLKNTVLMKGGDAMFSDGLKRVVCNRKVNIGMNKIACHLPHRRRGFLFWLTSDSFQFKFSKYLIFSVQHFSSIILSILQFSPYLSLSSSRGFEILQSVNKLCLHLLIHCNTILWPIASFLLHISKQIAKRK